MLLVEDDRLTYDALRAIFRHRGWDVTVATTLADALAAVDSHPDGIILDLMLPDGDGEAILKKVRRLGLQTPIVVTTGSNDRARLTYVQSLAPEALLHKPINLADLINKLEQPQ
ncbi:MAG TPA: response regulator [Tepidisphaeraceae bacterium]|nr:response regulator [Tepidisphaeraceae bacterium]